MTQNDFFHSLCNENIWNPNVTWHANSPNFNRCLRHTILTWIPCAFLFLFVLLEILYLKSLKVKHSSWRLLNSSRLFFTIAAVIANIVEFGYYVGKYLSADKYPFIYFVSSAIKVFTFVIITVLLLLQKDKGVPSLATPWVFIVINIVCFIPTISQLCLHSSLLDVFEFSFSIFYFSLLLLLFLLYSFADVPNKNKNSLLEQEETDTEREENTRTPCPESTASFPSVLWFWWFTDLAYLGYKKPLVAEDVFDLNEEDKCEVVVPAFENKWYSSGAEARRNSTYEEVRCVSPTTKRSVIKAIAKTFWYDLTIAALLLLLANASILLSPILLQEVLRFMSSNDPTWQGIILVLAMFSANVVANITDNLYFARSFKIQTKIQNCLTSIIYKKSLRISSAAKKTSTSGEVVNLMAVDTQRLLDIAPFLLYIFSTPLVVGVALWLMYNQLGCSALGGLSVLVIMVPVVYVTSHFESRFDVQQMKFKDKRLKYLNETLNGMKVMKLYAWEPSFVKLITDIRSKEMNCYKKVAYLFCVLMFQWTVAPFFVGFVTFAVYSFSSSSHVLTAEKIFVTLNLIEILNSPLTLLPQVISYSVLAYVSAKRIDKYLNAPELEDYVTRDDSMFGVEIKNGQFRWEPPEFETNTENGLQEQQTDPKNHTLDNINFQVKLGSLHAIVGQVGSGKSSLLSAILGEMEKVNGSVNIHRKLKIAYVPQQAWIENLTLRNNILFGNEYYKEKYETVLNKCALQPDLEILPAGDLTEIGEKGINLSGGQKQRVSLARACYRDADLYLFDDPLSAVDAHVAKHLFDHVLSSHKGLLKARTRILVTNSIDVLPKVDFITVLKDGRITEQGTYQELMEKDNEFAEFVNQFSSDRKRNFERQESTVSNSSQNIEIGDKKLEKAAKQNTLIEEETAEVGSVQLTVYKQYLKMVSIPWAILIIAPVIGFYGSQVAGNVWLSHWSSDNITGDVKHDTGQRNYRYEIYSIIGLLQVLTGFFGNFAVIKAGLRAAVKLHHTLLDRVFRSPMSFFETTPLGRILNRFSKDMDSVDLNIPWNLKEAIDRFFQLVFAIGVIAAQTGIFSLIILPLLIAYCLIQKLFIPTSRQLKRLNSTTKSPIYSHFTQTLQGVSTIRAFNENNRFIKESEKRVELNLICYYALIMSNRWFNVFLNLIGALVVLFVGFYATFKRDSLTAGMVGLSITYSLMMTDTLTWLVRASVTVETNIVAVERINEYCENETEADWEIESTKPPITWPQKGVIEFEKYGTRYRNGLDLVLNDISASIKENEKIGIVGRTGAGKSTITLSLFRILEAAKGKILIDGLDISCIGLHDLRSKLTIIPQDPVLFSGTLRFNLDPFDVYNDAQIWEALQHSHLKQFVSDQEKGLFHEITEGGENLSVGQRQLMCLARALLRKSKILVLDEATAAVDLETDSLIQTTIKNEFADCTTLTIAHRIQTILDCDRVMVIDKGSVIEFDSPSTLLSNPNSAFYSLARNAKIVL